MIEVTNPTQLVVSTLVESTPSSGFDTTKVIINNWVESLKNTVIRIHEIL